MKVWWRGWPDLYSTSYNYQCTGALMYTEKPKTFRHLLMLDTSISVTFLKPKCFMQIVHRFFWHLQYDGYNEMVSDVTKTLASRSGGSQIHVWLSSMNLFLAYSDPTWDITSQIYSASCLKVTVIYSTNISRGYHHDSKLEGYQFIQTMPWYRSPISNMEVACTLDQFRRLNGPLVHQQGSHLRR